MTQSRFSLKKMAAKSKEASFVMAGATSAQKNQALENLAHQLEHQRETILEANREDVRLARASGLSEAIIDRLALEKILTGMIADVRQVIQLPDPVGELFDKKIMPNHLEVVKCRTPIGVLGVIYESRPNVTVDVSTLAIKSGNCAILRGGSETLRTNQVLVALIQKALSTSGIPQEAIQLIPTTDRLQVKKLLRLHQEVDLIIPRGGASLHQFCRENSTIPVITGGIGICHLFADASADLKKSLQVILNAKTQRPTVCNALDTLLVHQEIAKDWIPQVVRLLHQHGVSFRLDSQAWDLMKNDRPQAFSCQLAQKEDWETEWLSLVLGIKVVKDIEEAVAHIRKYSTKHSDGILTNNSDHAQAFVRQVDSAAVYVNASTRFTDGGQLGLGSEVAISTQKLHARGPMGLQELTSYKWVIHGDYSVRR